MALFNNFKDIIDAARGRVLLTPYGKFNLAKKKDRRNLERQVVELQRSTDSLTRKDIGDWRAAWQMAINVDSPNRQRLYDIYRDVEIDLHLSGCIQQRRGFVMSRSFKITNQKGDEQPDAAKFFEQSWFRQFMRLALDSNWWGHSLIELGNLTSDVDGLPTYDGVRLITRKHVIPEYHRVITDLGQDWRTGIDYHEAPFADWLIEVGQPDDLGLFLKAATQTIPKKNAMAFWDTFAEIFGMPLRIGRTTSRDPKDMNMMEKMLAKMGTEGWALFQEGTTIDVVESARSDAFNVYDKRIDRANSELSKLIIGQTMTIEDGSSLSQSETHLKVFENLVEDDCDMIRDVTNGQLIPRMIRHGFPLQGLHFEWDYSIDYTPEQQKSYEEMVLNNYEVEGSYFEDKYGMPVGERRQQPAFGPTNAPQGNDGNEPGRGTKPAGKNQHSANNPGFFD